jgi:hypothetical protein
MRLLLLAAFAVSAMAQSSHITRITPNGSTTGKVEWYELFTNGHQKVSIQAADSLAADVPLKWPAALPAANGQCMVGSTAGQLSFTACSGGSFPVADSTNIISGSADGTKLLRFEVDGFSTATTRTLTPQNASYTIAGLELLQTFTASQTINAGINSGLTVTDGASTPIVGINFASGAAGGSMVVGTTSNHPLVLYVNNTQRAIATTSGFGITGTLAVSGITTLSNHLQFGADNTYAIGTAGTQPSVVYTRVLNSPKVEMRDTAGGAGFFYWESQVNASNQYTRLMDTGSTAVVEFSRLAAGSPTNLSIFATSISPRSNLGFSIGTGNSDRWLKGWFGSLDSSGAVAGASFSVGTTQVITSGLALTNITALNGLSQTEIGYLVGVTSAVQSQINNRGQLAGNNTWTGINTFQGSSVFQALATVYDIVPAATNTYSNSTPTRYWLDTYTQYLTVGTGLIYPSGAVNGYCMKTDAGGNAFWDPCGTSQWITSAGDIYYNGGSVTIGGTTPNAKLSVLSSINDGISVGDGTTRGILYSSSAGGNSLVFGTTSNHALLFFTNNVQRAALTAAGNFCLGCGNDTYRLEVAGTLAASGQSTLAAVTASGAIATGSTDLTTAQLFARASDVNGLRVHNSGTPSSGGGAGIQAAIESAPSSGHRLAFYSFGLRTGSTNYNGAAVTAFATQNWSPGSAQGTELRFETTADGSASRNTSLTVRSNGIAVTGSATISTTLLVSGNLTASAGVNVTGEVGATTNFVMGGTTVINSTRNLVNIVDITNSGNVNTTGYVAGGSMRVGATTFINSSLALTNISALNAVSATVINYLANITSDAQTQLNNRGQLGASNTWTQANTFNGLTTFGGSVSAQATLTTYDVIPATTNTYSHGNPSRYWLNSYTQYLTVGTGLTYPSGAVNGYCLKTDAGGNAYWAVCGTGVTSIATTGPISGGTITSTGTISCPTCFTTAGGTISGTTTIQELRFAAGSTYAIGANGNRALRVYADGLSLYGPSYLFSGASLDFFSGSSVDFSGTVTTGGSATATATYSCGSGQAIKTLTVSRGLITAASCGVP